jgi:DNA primase large subunit
VFGLVRESRLKELQKEYNELKLRLDRAREIEGQNQILQNEIQQLNNKIIELEKQIREQTEADLFFISAKIQKKLLEGEPKENINDLRLQQFAYQQQLQQMSNYQSWSLLQAIGSPLQNMFNIRY